jgi:murein L,D-transpeptidase YafK
MKKVRPYIILFSFLILLAYYFWPEKKLIEGQKIDKIIVFKREHLLKVYYKENELASYSISLSKKGLAKRTKQGDNLTPEGTFKLQKMSRSNYHRALGIGKWETCCGVRIHGSKNGLSFCGKFHRWIDWTEGCIALTNDEIDEIYAGITSNAVIIIYP